MSAASHCRTISAIADAMNPTAKWQDVLHASLGALALENARLYDENARKAGRLEPEEEGWHNITEA